MSEEEESGPLNEKNVFVSLFRWSQFGLANGGGEIEEEEDVDCPCFMLLTCARVFGDGAGDGTVELDEAILASNESLLLALLFIGNVIFAPLTFPFTETVLSDFDVVRCSRFDNLSAAKLVDEAASAACNFGEAMTA